MTTTIDIFQFTKPMSMRLETIQDEQVYADLQKEICKAMEEDCDADENSTHIYIEDLHGYFLWFNIDFGGYFRHDYESFDWGTEDFGEYIPTGECSISVVECCKLIDDGEATEDVDIDIARIERDVDRYFANY